MQTLKSRIWDVYAALIVVVAALLISGVQLALPYIV